MKQGCYILEAQEFRCERIKIIRTLRGFKYIDTLKRMWFDNSTDEYDEIREQFNMLNRFENVDVILRTGTTGVTSGNFTPDLCARIRFESVYVAF